jgi:outer membrane murein-binding lipoprotein Lpp
MKIFALIIGLTLIVAGCSSPISKQAKQDLAQPVNCATAEGDIRSLNAEKAHASSQVAAGVEAIVPVGLVMNVASGTEGDKAKIASGEYNKMLDKKIAEIKSTCGM